MQLHGMFRLRSGIGLARGLLDERRIGEDCLLFRLGGNNSLGSSRAGRKIMAAKKILMLVGDFVEDIVAMVPFQMLGLLLGHTVDAVCPGKKFLGKE